MINTRNIFSFLWQMNNSVTTGPKCPISYNQVQKQIYIFADIFAFLKIWKNTFISFIYKALIFLFYSFLLSFPCLIFLSFPLLFKFIEITLWHGCSPVNLLHIFSTPFSWNTSEWLLLHFKFKKLWSSVYRTVLVKQYISKTHCFIWYGVLFIYWCKNSF